MDTTQTETRRHNADVVRTTLDPSTRRKVETRVLRHLAEGEGSVTARVAAAAWEAVEEARSLGWTVEQVTALVESFAVLGADLIVDALRSTGAVR